MRARQISSSRFVARVFVLLAIAMTVQPVRSQVQQWRLWATGLQAGVFPRIAIGPDHSVYYGVLGTGLQRGVIYRAENALDPSGVFTALPQLPYVSIVNNIQALGTNAMGDPIVGISHGTAPGNLLDPAVFLYDFSAHEWVLPKLSTPVSAGIASIALSPDGTVWLGGKWARVYKSSDGGRSFMSIDEWDSVAASAPCFYPTWNGNGSDGAILAIAADRRGFVYAGTEGAGIIFSEDVGATWKPVDRFACMPSNPQLRNEDSPMWAASRTGNVGAIGFTRNNDVVWVGVDFWKFPDWRNAFGYADLMNLSTGDATGFPDFLIVSGTQLSKIVTTHSGRMFLHSGRTPSFDPSPPPPPLVSSYSMGIYSSLDGRYWQQENSGLIGANDGNSQGALAVDGDRVFTATADGRVWYLDVSETGLENFRDGFETR